MKRFEADRIFYHQLITPKFSHPIPIAYCLPLNLNKDSIVYVYNYGLGSTNSWNLYMNFPIFQSNYFVLYEKQGHGLNQNKPSQHPRKYVIELNEVIKWVKKQFPERRIFLLGESWGAAVNCLYYKKYQNEIINGLFIWNMPKRPVDISETPKKQGIIAGIKLLITLLFNIPFNNKPTKFIQDKLSQNAILVRAQKMAPLSSSNTKLLIAVWRSFKRAWVFLLNNINNEEKYNIFYLQSGQDALIDWKIIKKINSFASLNHYKFIETGFHVLSFEPKEADILYAEIIKFTQQNK